MNESIEQKNHSRKSSWNHDCNELNPTWASTRKNNNIIWFVLIWNIPIETLLHICLMFAFGLNFVIRIGIRVRCSLLLNASKFEWILNNKLMSRNPVAVMTIIFRPFWNDIDVYCVSSSIQMALPSQSTLHSVKDIQSVAEWNVNYIE